MTFCFEIMACNLNNLLMSRSSICSKLYRRSRYLESTCRISTSSKNGRQGQEGPLQQQRQEGALQRQGQQQIEKNDQLAENQPRKIYKKHAENVFTVADRYKNYNFPLVGVDLTAFLSKKIKFDFTFKSIMKSIKGLIEDGRVIDQGFIEERHKILGSNLSCAHFIVSRGGTVKFKGNDNWIKLDKNKNLNLPTSYVPNLYLEGIDTTGMNLLYEGLDNMTNLLELKSLIIEGPGINDWCLDRFYIFESVKHLTIKNCPNVTFRGLGLVHKMRNLKTLKLKDINHIEHLGLLKMLLEEALPNCKITNMDIKTDALAL